MGHHVRLLELTLDGDQEVAELLGQKLGQDVGVPVEQNPDEFIIFIELKKLYPTSTLVPAWAGILFLVNFSMQKMFRVPWDLSPRPLDKKEQRYSIRGGIGKELRHAP